ncbi:hypothetical protein [Undibacterium terreum]|uniref:Uncharacterized protein n=1 Tax=Undibacterium terreum TaxID=1224302 RepID=A0A916V244_9BURK|nr:hypothetical protein [Undibacterium terreum]GGC99174.1 hypothetical protein GCM10011396_53390 [Undibacterium terreum]
MELLQIQVIYQAEEDRILVKFSFGESAAEGERQEIRAHLTRRLLLRLWPTTLQALATQVVLNKPEAAHASADIVQMEHQSSLQKMHEEGGFSNPYQACAEIFPRGEAALLIHSINFNIVAGASICLQFFPVGQEAFEITMPETLLHGFCSLLQAATKEAEWGLELLIPGSEHASAAPRVLN